MVKTEIHCLMNFGHSLGLLHVDGADAWFLGLFGRSQYYDSYKQERNRYNVMFSGANSKYTDDYKSTDINPEQISIILENFRNTLIPQHYSLTLFISA